MTQLKVLDDLALERASGKTTIAYPDRLMLLAQVADSQKVVDGLDKQINLLNKELSLSEATEDILNEQIADLKALNYSLASP